MFGGEHQVVFAFFRACFPSHTEREERVSRERRAGWKSLLVLFARRLAEWAEAAAALAHDKCVYKSLRFATKLKLAPYHRPERGCWRLFRLYCSRIQSWRGESEANRMQINREGIFFPLSHSKWDENLWGKKVLETRWAWNRQQIIFELSSCLPTFRCLRWKFSLSEDSTCRMHLLKLTAWVSSTSSMSLKV